MRFLRGTLVTAILTVAVVSTAYAQAVGSVFGKATDSSGAVLPGVNVTVAGSGLQAPVSSVTGTLGTYTIPRVPIGTYTVTFEMNGFRKAVREGVVITSGFDAQVDIKMEIGKHEEVVTVISESPLVDTKKTTTGGDFTTDQLLKVPTARDPWQVINMATGIQLSGINVGGSASGQQLGISAYGSSDSVQWNLEGGNITDMASNSSPMYFNFNSFQEIQVVTGGGDVSVQSQGVFINLITKSGSNVLKGSADVTFENSSMQANNVTQAEFNSAVGSSSTGLSGNPLHRIDTMDGDIGGPIVKNKLWYWGSTDYQDINVGIANFFNTSLAGCNPPPSTFAQLSAVQGCLNNDKTTIQDFNGKLNFQLNTTNKFQLLMQSDRKLRNNRGANSTTAPEATFSQYSAGGIWHFQNPTIQLTHTWLPSDKAVFVTQVTHVQGGFFLDNHDYTNTTCGSSSYQRDLAGQDPTDPTCQFNVQSLLNITSGLSSRSINTNDGGSYQSARPSWEVKTDGNYFVPHLLGGDHAFKFGVGWRKDPVLSYSHAGGDALAYVQCAPAGCGNNAFVPTNGVQGLVPYQADLVRDSLTNHDWWTWNGYVQDAFTSKRLTVSAGVRDDWQDSKFLGGCVSANTILPLLLPQQCQGPASTNQPFNNLSPRVSATYDLTGHGTTAIHGSFSYYHQTEEVLADGLDGLGQVVLSFGSNNLDGTCANVAGSSCWTDANHDGIVQANELIGVPSGPGNFVNGVLLNTPPLIDSNLQLLRTREGIIGLDHQLMGNLHVTADFIYRKMDRGAQQYISGIQPGQPGFPASSLWSTSPVLFTDPNTGTTVPYFVALPGVTLPSAVEITSTATTYSTYHGAIVTLAKRFSNRWQGSLSYTWNDYRAFQPAGSFSTTGSFAGDPTVVSGSTGTDVQFTNGFTNNTPRYQVKGFGSVELPWWGLLVATNINVLDGNIRTLTVKGPGQVSNCPPGTPVAQCTAGVVRYNSLAFQNAGTTRLSPVKDVDLSIAKNLDIGRQKLTLTLNCFNLFNINTPLSFASQNTSNNGTNGTLNTFSAISSIVPPRVFRIDLRYAF